MTETTIQAALAEKKMAQENIGIVYRTVLRQVHCLQAAKVEQSNWPTKTIEDLLWAIEHACSEHDQANDLLGQIRGIAERHGIPRHASLTAWIESLVAKGSP